MAEERYYASLEEKIREEYEDAIADSATALSQSNTAIEGSVTSLRGELTSNKIYEEVVNLESLETGNGVLDTFTFPGVSIYLTDSEMIVHDKEVKERNVEYIAVPEAGSVVFQAGYIPLSGKVYITCKKPYDWNPA